MSVKLFFFLFFSYPSRIRFLIEANTWSKWWINKWRPPLSDILRLRNPEYLILYCPLVLLQQLWRRLFCKIEQEMQFHRDRARADPDNKWPYIHKKRHFAIPRFIQGLYWQPVLGIFISIQREQGREKGSLLSTSLFVFQQGCPWCHMDILI